MTDMIAWTFLLLWVALPPILAAAVITARHLAHHAALPVEHWTARPVPAPLAAG